MSKGVHDFILERLEPKVDLRKVAVVLPSLRASFFMDKDLAGRWGVVLPPKVFSVGQFWDFLLSRYKVFRRVEAIDVLVDLKSVVERFLPEMKDWALFYPWANSLFSCLEQLILSGVPFNRIGEVKHLLVGHDSNDVFYRLWDSMVSIMEAFYSRLEEKKHFTRALVVKSLWGLIEEVEVPFERVIVAGLFLESALEMSCLRKLREKGVEVYLLGMSIPFLRNRFEQLKASLFADEVWWMDVDVSKVELRSCTSELEQVEKVIASLPSEIQDPEAVGVVLPRETLLLPFLRALSQVKFPINISMGYPLRSTAGYDFLQRMFRLFERTTEGRFFYKDYLDLLGHFYLSPLLSNLRTIRKKVIDFVYDTGQVFIHPQQVFASESKFNSLGLTRIHECLEKVCTTRTAGEVIQALVDLFWWIIRENELLQKDDVERAVAYKFYLALSDLLSTSIFREEVPFRILFRYVTAVLTQEHISFEGSPLEGLQIMGMLQARNLGFRELHYLDLNEGICPPRVGVDLFLTDPIRRFLGMPELKDREEMFAYDFYSSLALSDKVYLYCVNWPDGRFPVSRFVYQLEFLAQKTGSTLKRVRDERDVLIFLPQEEVRFTKTPADLEKISKFSPSALDTYLFCPIRFYYKYILEIPERLRGEEDIDSREVGTLVHEVLSEVFHPYVKKDLNENFFSTSIGSIPNLVRECGERVWGKVKARSVRGEAMLQVIARRLQDFLDRERKRWREEVFWIEFVEWEDAKYLEADLSLDDSSVKIYGRVDRIDRINDTLVIWDYKTGTIHKPNIGAIINAERRTQSHPREEVKDLYRSVQLPLYLLLLERDQNLSPDRCDAGLISLKDLEYVRLLFSLRKKRKLTSSQESTLFEVITQDILSLIKEIRDLDVPYYPDVSNCEACPYRSACIARS